MSTTRTLLSLQWTLWKRTTFRSPQLIIGSLIMALLVIGQCAGLGAYSRYYYLETGSTAAFVFTMSFGSLLYLAISIMSPSSESQVEPRHLATFSLTARDILPGLMLTKFIQTGSIISCINTLIMAIIGAFTFSGATIPLWIVACAVQLALTLFLGEALSLTMNRLGGTQFKERLGFVSTMLVSTILLGFVVLINSLNRIDADVLMEKVVPILGWTPFGAAAYATTHLLAWIVALVGVVIALWLWHSALNSMIRTPVGVRGGGVNRRAGSTILLPWAHAGQFGALYSRALRYWLRDARQLTNMAMFPMFALMYLALAWVQDDNYYSWFGLIFLVLSAGSSMSNEVGMDGPANWVHITTGVSARTWLWARYWAGATVMMAWMLLIGLLLGFLNHFAWTWQATIGFAIQVTAINLALGLWTAVQSPSPTTKPSGSVNRQKNNSSFATSMIMMILSIIALLCAVPSILVMFLSNSVALGLAIQVAVSLVIVLTVMKLAEKKLAASWPRLFFLVREWAG